MNLIFLILGSILPYLVSSIFQDQAGKFDWRKQLIGCPRNVVFDRVQKGSDKILVSTEDDILSSLSANTGEIAWRRILKKKNNPNSASLHFVTDEDNIYSITDEGTLIRVWRKADGLLIWQLNIDEQISELSDVKQLDDVIVIANQKRIVSFSKNQQQQISTVGFESNADFSKFTQIGDEIFHSFVPKQRSLIQIRKIDKNGAISVVKSVNIRNFSPERCSIIGKYIGYWHSDTLFLIDLELGIVIEKNTGILIRQIAGTSKTIAIRGPSEVKLYSIKSDGNLEEISKNYSNDAKFIVTVENNKHLALISKENVQIVSLNDGSILTTSKLPKDTTRVSPRNVFVGSISDNEFELVYVGDDCRVEMITLDSEKGKTNWEWSREESLMRVAAVEMVDLPLSESQQLIEDEFEDGESNIISAFIRRVYVQFGQLRRWIIRTAQEIFTISTTISTRANGISDFINAMRSSSPSGLKNGPFERDYFNLRKVIIVSTFDGVLFGLDSIGGDVLWKIWLGNNFSPLKGANGKEEVALFVQRTTAHYQLNGLASVIFADKGNNGIIVGFNPIDGKVVTTEMLGAPIKKISLLPFVDKNHVQPLVIVEKNEGVRYFPDVPKEILSTASDIFILDVDYETKKVRGLKIDLINKALKTAWSGNLGLTKNDRIVDVKGKAFNQKVHSQGRVLVNREVQYKYVNPNLAAIASIDSQSQYLTIILIDVVSGQIVHTASLGRSNAPIHFVHYENWIAYSYWSEKGRRTELGIIELYEGSETLSQKDVFDSKIPTNKPPVVLSQSYIYAQGIEAMAVSETEQGLTTRSILLALPCGNIHEVSKRILDATRPLELTQAMREEMMIGYMPEIAIASEEMINYNQTIHRVRGMKTAPSGLESTSLVLAYGTDLFFTRLTPSGTFDILKDDFDHVLISLVLSALVIGTYITKRWSRSNALAAQWA